MFFWRRLLWRLRHFTAKDKLEAELQEEMQFHLEMLQQETGAAARREFGNRALMHEDSRAAWTWRWLDELSQDLRYAGRNLRRDWSSAAAAVGGLSLGIGFSIAVFTLVNAVLLRPLPYKEPERLVMIWAVNAGQGWDQEKISGAEMLDWQRSGLFESVVGFVPNMTAVTGPGTPVFTHGYAVTPGFLPLLGVQPMLGRAFSPDEERKGGDKQRVLLRHSFWVKRFGSDPGIIGKTMLIEERPYVIVGVMGPDFQFFNRQTDLYLPTPWSPADERGRGRGIRAIGRLKDGLSLEEAQVRASTLAAQMAKDYPESNRGWTIRLSPVPADTSGPVRPALWALLASVGMVLLIACSNVTGLLLAQGMARAREFSLRAALGARRSRILRQVLTESFLLALVSGCLGFLIARISVEYLQNTLPAQYSVGRFLIQMERIRIDAWVAFFAAGIVPLCAVAFGIVPAWRLSQSASAEALKESSRSTGWSLSGRRLQEILVAAEVALAVVLVIGAALMTRSFERLYQRGPGFAPEGVKSLYVALPTYRMRLNEPEAWVNQVAPVYESVLASVAAEPGVEGVAAINHLPLAGFYYLASVELEGINHAAGQYPQAIDRYVSSSYHPLLHVPLLAGRYFNRSDVPKGARVAIVNEAFARQYFGSGSPVGRQMRYAGSGQAQPWVTIVGVVGTERATGMDEKDKPTVYFAMSQNPFSLFHLIVKSRQPLDETVRLVTSAIRRINPQFAPYEIRTFDDLVLDSTWRVRYSMMLLLAMSAVALLLASLGVYSVLSYAVRKRTREIGVRMALGASRVNILRMVVVDALRLGAVGIVAGLVAAVWFTRLFETLLYGVPPLDPAIYAAVSVLLVLTVAVAALAPARRATGLLPSQALRDE